MPVSTPVAQRLRSESRRVTQYLCYTTQVSTRSGPSAFPKTHRVRSVEDRASCEVLRAHCAHVTLVLDNRTRHHQALRNKRSRSVEQTEPLLYESCHFGTVPEPISKPIVVAESGSQSSRRLIVGSVSEDTVLYQSQHRSEASYSALQSLDEQCDSIVSEPILTLAHPSKCTRCRMAARELFIHNDTQKAPRRATRWCRPCSYREGHCGCPLSVDNSSAAQA